MAVIIPALNAVPSAITALLRDRDRPARPGTQLDAAPLPPDKHPPDQMSAPLQHHHQSHDIGASGASVPRHRPAVQRRRAPARARSVERSGPSPDFSLFEGLPEWITGVLGEGSMQLQGGAV